MASMPNSVQKAIAANELSQWFDLREVPGFYREVVSQQPASGPNSAEHSLTREWGPWRINLPPAGVLVPYYDQAGYIIGIKIFRTVKDAHPTLMTSRGL